MELLTSAIPSSRALITAMTIAVFTALCLHMWMTGM